jgi:hypothetical protein
MAFNLSTLRHFPLYYYGLHYLLGVQAWLIAIFFWLFHPSVAVMRVPLIALNAVVAVWVIAETSSRARIRPALAFIAALPLVIPAPAAAAHLLEAAGASIEPFVYILLLWRTRRRPFVFGLILAVGALHREFTLFALPALLVAVVATDGIRSLFARATLRFAGWMMAGISLVCLVVDDLKLRLEGSSIALQAVSLGGQMCSEGRGILMRARDVATRALPVLFGGLPVHLSAFRMDTVLVTGSKLAGFIAAVALVAMVGRVLWLLPSRREAGDVSFGIYLSSLGACAAAAYPLSCNIQAGAPPILRYLLLALLLPVGIAVLFFQLERLPRFRAAGAAALVIWAAFNLNDHVRLIRSAAVAPPLDERRALADYLTMNHIRYARAIYWDAYVVDFLTLERVVTASVDVVRIPEYQTLVDEHANEAVTLARVPCSGGERVASWCVQRP